MKPFILYLAKIFFYHYRGTLSLVQPGYGLMGYVHAVILKFLKNDSIKLLQIILYFKISSVSLPIIY